MKEWFEGGREGGREGGEKSVKGKRARQGMYPARDEENKKKVVGMKWTRNSISI